MFLYRQFNLDIPHCKQTTRGIRKIVPEESNDDEQDTVNGGEQLHSMKLKSNRILSFTMLSGDHSVY